MATKEQSLHATIALLRKERDEARRELAVFRQRVASMRSAVTAVKHCSCVMCSECVDALCAAVPDEEQA